MRSVHTSGSAPTGRGQQSPLFYHLAELTRGVASRVVFIARSPSWVPCSPELPGFIATMDPLTPDAGSTPGAGLSTFPMPPSVVLTPPRPAPPVSSIGSPCTGTDSPLTRQASPFPSRLAVRHANRVHFRFWTNGPSPAALHPALLRAVAFDCTPVSASGMVMTFTF